MANSRINNAVRTHAATHLYKTVIVMEICCSLISFFVQYFFFFFQTCLKSKEILHRTEWQNQFKFMIKKKKIYNGMSYIYYRKFIRSTFNICSSCVLIYNRLTKYLTSIYVFQ